MTTKLNSMQEAQMEAVHAIICDTVIPILVEGSPELVKLYKRFKWTAAELEAVKQWTGDVVIACCLEVLIAEGRTGAVAEIMNAIPANGPVS